MADKDMEQHERIWLEAVGNVDPIVGRMWSFQNVWGDGVEYIRADAVSKEDSSTQREIDGGRFGEWSLRDIAAQCRMQSREQLDPEFSQFMAEVSDRIFKLMKTADEMPEAFLHKLVENAYSWGKQDENHLNPSHIDSFITATRDGMTPKFAARWKGNGEKATETVAPENTINEDLVTADEMPRAANALLNHLWLTVWSGARTHEENWEEMDRHFPQARWLHESIKEAKKKIAKTQGETQA